VKHFCVIRISGIPQRPRYAIYEPAGRQVRYVAHSDNYTPPQVCPVAQQAGPAFSLSNSPQLVRNCLRRYPSLGASCEEPTIRAPPDVPVTSLAYSAVFICEAAPLKAQTPAVPRWPSNYRLMFNDESDRHFSLPNSSAGSRTVIYVHMLTHKESIRVHCEAARGSAPARNYCSPCSSGPIGSMDP
jgi:hypothetical protein